ncbi:something about silencing protein 10 [Microplitis demolitor]|uniref:something about silencing protein 10 n=1 Tax=Microplitis demolitor TaxID=69319 RepID=UPI000440003F|nr:something about silencing protein 10 [Microplitis demolitor]
MVVKKKFKKDYDDIENFDDDDITGSDDDLSDSEKRLLEKVRKKRVQENFDSDDEVYGLQDDKGDDDEEDEDAEGLEAEDAAADDDSMESDIERPQEDDDLPNERAWGKKKKDYYSTDFVDPDYATLSHKKMQEAEEEEKEARNIQQRLAEQLDDADFGLDLLPPPAESEQAPEERVVKTDLSKLSKREKVALFQKESPEFQALVTDFEERLKEANDILLPFINLAEQEEMSDPAIKFVKLKYQLVLNYCINISFYLMLKAKKIPVTSHPVIKKLAQYRQLLSQLEASQGHLLEQVSEVLKSADDGESLKNILRGTKSSDEVKVKSKKRKDRDLAAKTQVKKKKPDTPESDEESEDDNAIMDDMSEDNDVPMENEEVEPEAKQEVSEGEKRAITYQIAKNKGLTPHRKKEQRNPRVKHRNKYRKAKIRRKGAVREVRKELTRYAGEISGIKASVKKSIKLK